MASWLYRTTPSHCFNPPSLSKICLYKKKHKTLLLPSLLTPGWCSKSWNLTNLFTDALVDLVKNYKPKYICTNIISGVFQTGFLTVCLIWHSLWAGTRSYAKLSPLPNLHRRWFTPRRSTLTEDSEAFKVCAEALSWSSREAGPSGWCSHTRSLQRCDLHGPHELLEML